MSSKILLRRGTAAQWSSADPILGNGELGIETDTLKIKLGNGSSTWTQITTYMNIVPDGNLTIGDYVLVTDIGAVDGVVGLDNSKNAYIPGSSIIVEGSTDNSFETTLTVTDPTADRTITFKNADGTVAFVTDIPSNTDALTEGSTNKYFTDERAQDAVAVALAAGTHTNISVSYNDAGNAISLTGAQTYNDENAQDAIGNNLGTGLSYNDTTGAISVDSTIATKTYADSAVNTGISNLVASSPATLDTLNELAAALGNDANFATTTATSIGNKVSKAGGDIITSSLASTISLRIKAAESQTANLTEWQTSTGQVNANFGSTGAFYNYIGMFADNTNSGITSLTVTTAYASIKPLIIKGAASQSVSLQQWQDSAGTVLASVNPNGFLQSSVGFASTTSGQTIIRTNFDTGAMAVTTQDPAHKALVVRGFASQTANLQEWQNSAGTVLASVISGGSIRGFAGLYGANSANSAVNPLFVVNSVAANVVAVIKGAASQTANLTEWQDSTGLALLRINSAGQVQALQPASVGFVVKAATTLTATITNAVGDGTTVTYTATNTFTAGQTVTVTGVDPVAYNLTSVTIATANATTFTVTNAAVGTYVSGGTAGVGQSANIFESRYGDNSLNTYIDKNGQLSAYSSGTPLAISRGGTNETNISFFNNVWARPLGQIRAIGTSDGAGYRLTNSSSANEYSRFTPTGVVFGNNIGALSSLGQITAYANSAATIGAVIRGAASQTANLQEWQNSAGSVLGGFSAYGSMYISNQVQGGTAQFGNMGFASASQVVLKVQGVTSQTANLQEWQNSSGTVVAKVQSSGGFVSYANSLFTAGLLVTGNYGGTSTFRVENNQDITSVVVKGNSTQTANLQEWQNSAGTVLANIDNAGNLIVPLISTPVTYSSIVYAGQSWSGGTGLLNVSPYNAAQIPLAVRGFASQTANLQEWQDSAGAVLSKINSTGAMFTITPADSTNTTQVATTAYVKSNINNLINSAPGTLDTLGEIATALAADESAAAALTTLVNTKAPIASPTFTGTVSGITKTMVGLGSVDNTADTAKPISTATQTALDLKSNNAITINSQTSNYTILLADYNKLIEMSAGGTLTITDSASFPVGFTCDILQTGASQVTIAGTSFTPDATPGLKLRAQWSSATLIKRALNSWVVLGDLSA